MNEKKIETAKMLIQFFNFQAGTSIRVNNEYNQRTIIEILNTNAEVADIKNHIKDWEN